MSSMAIDRRHLLIGTALTIAAASASRAFAGMLDDDTGSGVAAGDLIAACRRPDGTYSVVVLNLDGTVLRELPLEGRGHDIALDRPSGRAVVFARRPGSFALAFDIHDRAPARAVHDACQPPLLRPWRVLARRPPALCHRA